VAKLQRACLRDPVKVEVGEKCSTVDTLKQQARAASVGKQAACFQAVLVPLRACL
jgi:hypothetical protein